MKKNVLVTGCNGQLGKSLVEYLSCDYVVHGIDIEENNNTKINFTQGDITQEDFWVKFVQENKDLYFTSLINNAGSGVFTPFSNRTVDELQAVIQINTIAPLLAIKHLCENAMVSNVVSIGSIYAEIAPDFSMYKDTSRMSSEIYGMTKAGIIYLTKYFAKYYENSEIRFNCVSPGGIERDQGPIFKEKYSQNTMMNRMAEVGEVAKVVKFLCSTDASYINGENIFVDGGITKW